MWFATYGGGLNRLKDEKIIALTESNGLLNNSVSRILVDDDDRFWLNTNFGVMAVARDVLDRAADGTEKYVTGTIYGIADGMPSSEANGGIQSAGFRDSGGRLWFPMLEDVVVIDPDRLDKYAPKVVIEGAWSRSGEPGVPSIPISFDPGKEFEIANELRNIEISYTGLSFRKPESIRFFYKLEGLDKDWVDAGTARSVFYPYLPPGNYTFRVKALGGNGVWSETIAAMRIAVPRNFSESPWAFVLAVGLVILFGFVLYRFRVRQLERIRSAQTEFSKRLLNFHEGERRKMASDLHDGLGQNLLLIKNWASLAGNAEANKAEVADYVEKISSTAADTLEETRAIVQNLGPQNLRRFGLTEAIVNMIEQLEDASQVLFETRLHNIDGLFSEDAEISIFRIIQECLNNVVKHSKSPTGLVEIKRSEGHIIILVEDKGIGFDTEKMSTEAAGIGLMGISQRVSFLDGDLEIDSGRGKGTTVKVKIGIPDAKRDQNSDSG